MAKSQYSGDSPFPSPISERHGISGSPETIPVTSIPFPALPAIEPSSMPALYILKDSPTMYVGEGVDYMRRLREHGVADPTPRPGVTFPLTASTID